MSTQIKEHPITFSSEMIRAVLDNHKTQTRRTWGLEFVNQDPDAFEFVRMEGDLAVFQLSLPPKQLNFVDIHVPDRSMPKVYRDAEKNLLYYIKCPYGQVGDGLYLKETWSPLSFQGRPPEGYLYKADFSEADLKAEETDLKGIWKSPRFMPRRTSRKDMVITELRAERLQSITYKDIVYEGIPSRLVSTYDSTRNEFAQLWNSINAKRGYSWESNPWVLVIGW